MKVLVVNAGSSSLKCQLIDTADESVSMKCLAEKVGTDDAYMNVSFAPRFDKNKYDVGGLTVEGCLGKLLSVLETCPTSSVQDIDQIGAIGNRIVAGGEYFTSSTLINRDAREKLALCEELAPLHNPNADACIDAMHKLLPGIPQVAVFDTAFHSTMPQSAFMYPLPMRYYEQYKIRRFGAHGTSHRFIAEQAAKMLGRPLEELNLITCHLGNGSSISAIENGKSVDTSMGFTPLDGLMMGTRTGSIDPAILIYIMRRENMSLDDMDDLLNKQSGILGISGVSADVRDVLAAEAEGNELAHLAIEMFVYRVQKTVGSYFAILPRTDAVVLTAGIGENSADVRQRIFSKLSHLGMVIDEQLNFANDDSENKIISNSDSPVKICVVKTNEELCIARETASLVESDQRYI